MVLRLLRTLALLLLLTGVPAAAHENHMREQTEKVTEPRNTVAPATPGAAHEAMREHMEAMEEQADADRPLPERLLNWLGRMHPFFVHFPIALFPIAWIALILARRRGEAVEIIRAFIIVAGVAAVVATAAGWLGAGFMLADRDEILTWHRWIGTALGVVGAVVALWAWRRREAATGSAMTIVLGIVTAALLVQGWLGGAVTHGLGHMMF